MNRAIWYIFAFATLFFGGCTALAPRIDYDPAFNATALTTFGVAKEASTLSPLDNERVEAALVEALEAKGYRFNDGGQQDFHALYRVETFHDVPSNFTFGLGIGGGSWEHGGVQVGTSVTPHHDEIELSIEMVRPGDHRVFWSGRTRAELPALDSPQKRQRFFRQLVEEVLKAYPRHRR